MSDLSQKIDDEFQHIGAAILASGGNKEWPTNRTVGEFDLRCTCSSHPEQYDVFKGDTQVAYFRLRHGTFRVDMPNCGGETVYVAEPNGDGLFDADERDHFLQKALEVVESRLPDFS